MGEDGALLSAAKSARSSFAARTCSRVYENNDKANAEAFRNGWFRTGDQGALDADGYLA